MEYISTRGFRNNISSSQAILSGIAPDGGLFVPEFIPFLSDMEILSLYNKSFQEISKYILSFFLTDFTDYELKDCINSAYNTKTFDTPLICPLRPLGDNVHFLELWHGPTCAFKDIALQILPHLLTVSAKKNKDEHTFVILTATSGDTGKAALEGFKDVPNTKIIVFFPQDGVSQIQKLQMTTQEGSNVHVIGVKGNFDHVQSGVKEIFTDEALSKELLSKNIKLSSANSINWGRLLPQIVYYFSSYMSLLKSSHIKYGDKINICIPTGNFGNIMAGYYAKKMGLPINKLIIAANQNNVLSNFIQNGIYQASRELLPSISPSMDILISSNFERLLFEFSGHDSEMINSLMSQLKENRKYTIDINLLFKIREHFAAGSAAEDCTLRAIRKTYKKYGYVMDPHTAVGLHVHTRYAKRTGDNTRTVIASTASPYKFNKSVLEAVAGSRRVGNNSEMTMLNLLASLTNTLIPEPLRNLYSKPVLHNTVCDRDEMKKAVTDILKL